jgi:hypothetical protein
MDSPLAKIKYLINSYSHYSCADDCRPDDDCYQANEAGWRCNEIFRMIKSIFDFLSELEDENKSPPRINMEKKKKKIKKVMHEFKEGNLRSGSKKGPEVTSPRQAIAIALSEARRNKK